MITTTCGTACDALNGVLRLDVGYQLAACPKCMDAILIDHSGDEPEFIELDGVDKLEDLAPPGSVMAGVFGMIYEAIRSLPVLPHVTQRVLSMIHDPIISMTDLATVINEDATISLKVLRVSNSALYVGTHEIKDLHVACARLGLRTVANVVSAAANGNLYRAGSRDFRSLMTHLWEHAVTTAHCADKIAAGLPGEEHRSAFVAGLVHDIGKLVLLDALTTKYRGNVGRLRESPELLVKVLDRFHALAGLHVVQFWKMPCEFAFTTYYNSRPERVPIESLRSLTHVVALASAMADSCGRAVSTQPVEPNPAAVLGHPSARALGLTMPKIEGIQIKVMEELDTVLETFSTP